MYKEENYCPNAKTSEIVIQSCGDELIIYNLITDKAYCLNKPLADIWQMCDGQNSISNISSEIGKKTRLQVTEDYIWLCLNDLNSKGLVDLPDFKAPLSPSNRRKVIKQIGLSTALALPLITLLVAPKAINAASGGSCNPASCPSNCCFNDVCTPFNQFGAPEGQQCFGDFDCQSECCFNMICAPACGSCFPN